MSSLPTDCTSEEGAIQGWEPHSQEDEHNLVTITVEEGGSEAKDEDVEEPAQFPVLPPLVYLPPQLSHVNALTTLQLLKPIKSIDFYDFYGFDPPQICSRHFQSPQNLS